MFSVFGLSTSFIAHSCLDHGAVWVLALKTMSRLTPSQSKQLPLHCFAAFSLLSVGHTPTRSEHRFYWIATVNVNRRSSTKDNVQHLSASSSRCYWPCNGFSLHTFHPFSACFCLFIFVHAVRVIVAVRWAMRRRTLLCVFACDYVFCLQWCNSCLKQLCMKVKARYFRLSSPLWVTVFYFKFIHLFICLYFVQFAAIQWFHFFLLLCFLVTYIDLYFICAYNKCHSKPIKFIVMHFRIKFCCLDMVKSPIRSKRRPFLAFGGSK